MFDFVLLILSGSVFEKVHLSCILILLAFGILIIILHVFVSVFLKYDHTNSVGLFFALIIGFVHQCFLSANWLKSTCYLNGITVFVTDWYTVPVACLILTIGVLFLEECSKDESKTKIYTYGAFISLVLLLVFGMGIHGISNQHANYMNYYNLKFHKAVFVDNKTTLVSFALEYLLVYAPVSVTLLWNRKECVLMNGQQGNVYILHYTSIRVSM